MSKPSLPTETAALRGNLNPRLVGLWLFMLVMLGLLFREAAGDLYYNISRESSYYSHSLLIPFVSLFFAWLLRNELAALPKAPTNFGYVVLVAACVLIILGDLLGFRIFAQLAMIPLLVGLGLIFYGWGHVRLLWFPILFLLFMIPMPESITTGLTFRVKILAAEGAVQLASMMFLPIIRDGSYIHIGEEFLLVGDVCGGMRSLISLLALGAVMSYVSETQYWARVLILLIAGPIAILSNLMRIFLLCVVAHFWGSSVATGWVHDISGFLIYAIALGLLFGVEVVLRKVAPRTKSNSAEVS